ncbi:MAG: glycoside hydrolase family 25 protein [Oscillospiraceae bacterium]|jgi:lysozyme|nr:glycoside hydrolase family 25 protein [Oscillospiraceae bacterium]
MATLLKGIDVSVHQGTITWDKVGKQDIDFAMIRSSYGLHSRDSKFDTNVKGAQSVGIDVGAYHFSYASSIADVKAEAKNFLAAIKGYKLTMPVVYDLESNSTTNKVVSQWTDMAITFLDIMEQNGYFAMLYGSKYSLEQQMTPSKLKPYAIWVAQWASKNTCTVPWGMWQYTDSGKVAGISTLVDMDVTINDYAAIIKKAKLNNL